MEKFAKKYNTSQKFEVPRQILNKIGAELCENLY